jgi:hypothetical protein
VKTSVQYSDVMRATIGIRAVHGRVGQALRDLLEHAGELAADEMIAKVPFDDGELAASIRVGNVEYRPGGRGGGGHYVKKVEAGEGVAHARFVFEGTGPAVGEPPIRSETPGQAMPMTEGNVPFAFAMSTQGQRPETEWVTDAQEAARRYIQAGIRAIDLGPA